MKNMIGRFEQNALSRAEMKKVVGGANFDCWCTQGSNSFGKSVNSFKDFAQMMALVANNCKNGKANCSTV